MKKTLLFGVLAAFAISALSVQSLNAQNPVKTATQTEKAVENKAVKTDKAVKNATPENKIEKQSAKDVKPAPSATASDCCKKNKECDKTCKNKTSKDTTCKDKLSTTNASNQPNAAVKPKPTTKPQSSSNSNSTDR